MALLTDEVMLLSLLNILLPGFFGPGETAPSTSDGSGDLLESRVAAGLVPAAGGSASLRGGSSDEWA
jgi:hypothetical protein